MTRRSRSSSASGERTASGHARQHDESQHGDILFSVQASDARRRTGQFVPVKAEFVDDFSHSFRITLLFRPDPGEQRFGRSGAQSHEHAHVF
jgi:hypothetical protein